MVAHAQGAVLERGVDGGLPRGRERGSVLRENRVAGGRRRARGRAREPVDGEVGGEVERRRRVHQVDGHVGVQGPRRGRGGERAGGRGARRGGEVGLLVQRRGQGGDEAGRDVGRARRRAHAKDVGRSTTRTGGCTSTGTARTGASTGTSGRTGTGVVGTHAQLRVARSHRTLAVPHGGAAAAANRRGAGAAKGKGGSSIITPHRGMQEEGWSDETEAEKTNDVFFVVYCTLAVCTESTSTARLERRVTGSSSRT